jgi:hypothetical protein
VTKRHLSLVEASPLPAFTEAVQAKVLSEITEGVPLATALLAEGIDVKAFKLVLSVANGRKLAPEGMVLTEQFRQGLLDFERDAVQATAICEAQVAKKVYQASQQANERTGLNEWRSGAWLLNNSPATRQSWHEHKELAIEHRHVEALAEEHRLASGMSLAELADCIEDPEWRELLDAPSQESANPGA